MFPDNLTALVEGDIAKVERTIKIVAIRVHYQCRIPRDKEKDARRALELHVLSCPAYQTVKDAIDIRIDADFELSD